MKESGGRQKFIVPMTIICSLDWLSNYHTFVWFPVLLRFLDWIINVLKIIFSLIKLTCFAKLAQFCLFCDFLFLYLLKVFQGNQLFLGTTQLAVDLDLLSRELGPAKGATCIFLAPRHNAIDVESMSATRQHRTMAIKTNTAFFFRVHPLLCHHPLLNNHNIASTRRRRFLHLWLPLDQTFPSMVSTTARHYHHK